MGRYKQGILGPFSGKVGSVVGSFWNGVYYMRSLAPHVANPRTEDQVRVRRNFALISETLRPFAFACRLGFVSLSGQSAWSAAVSENWRVQEVAQGSGTWTAIAPADIILTNGTELFDVQVTKARNNEYEATWLPVEASSGLDGATVYLVMFNAANKMVEVFRAAMSAGSLAVNVAGMVTGVGDVFTSYCFAATRDRSSYVTAQTYTE